MKKILLSKLTVQPGASRSYRTNAFTIDINSFALEWPIVITVEVLKSEEAYDDYYLSG